MPAAPRTTHSVRISAASTGASCAGNADGVAMAGEGDLVTIVASREAAITLPESFVPVDHAITSIVDDVVV